MTVLRTNAGIGLVWPWHRENSKVIEPRSTPERLRWIPRDDKKQARMFVSTS